MPLISRDTFIKIININKEVDSKRSSFTYIDKDNNVTVCMQKGDDFFLTEEKLAGSNDLTECYKFLKNKNHSLVWKYEEDEDLLSMPKIYKVIQTGIELKHFHDINYKTELTVSIYAKRDFHKGELREVIWYLDKQCTDPLIKVSIVYERDAFGFATGRTTIREWYNVDNTLNEESKITIKYYNINVLDTIEEGVKRRGNIIKSLQIPILNFLVSTVTGMEVPDIIQIGRDFLKVHKSSFSSFIDESHKQIQDDITNATDFWLDNVISGDGSTIRDYILEELNI